MRFYTWCNQPKHPKLKVLEQSARKYGITIQVLGKGIVWKRNYQKIGLLYKAIKDLPEHEIVLASDSFDVLYLDDEDSFRKKFHKLAGKPVSGVLEKVFHTQNPIIFGAEKLYSHHWPKYRSYWDKLNPGTKNRYLNSGTFMGYQKDVALMLRRILETTKNYRERSDQKLFGKYAVEYPGSIILDVESRIFWCLGGEQRAKKYVIHSSDSQKSSPGSTIASQGSTLLQTIETDSFPCMIHIPASKRNYDILLEVARRMRIITVEQQKQHLKKHQEEMHAKGYYGPNQRNRTVSIATSGRRRIMAPAQRYRKR